MPLLPVSLAMAPLTATPACISAHSSTSPSPALSCPSSSSSSTPSSPSSPLSPSSLSPFGSPTSIIDTHLNSSSSLTTTTTFTPTSTTTTTTTTTTTALDTRHRLRDRPLPLTPAPAPRADLASSSLFAVSIARGLLSSAPCISSLPTGPTAPTAPAASPASAVSIAAASLPPLPFSSSSFSSPSSSSSSPRRRRPIAASNPTILPAHTPSDASWLARITRKKKKPASSSSSPQQQHEVLQQPQQQQPLQLHLQQPPLSSPLHSRIDLLRRRPKAPLHSHSFDSHSSASRVSSLSRHTRSHSHSAAPSSSTSVPSSQPPPQPHSHLQSHLHSPSHSQSPPLYNAQTTSSSGSLKESLRSSLRSASLFGSKRHHRFPLPFPHGEKASSNINLEQHQKRQQILARTTNLSAALSPTMQQVEYMADAPQSFSPPIADLSLHPFDTPSSLSAPAQALVPQKQTLSSKRSRPPLAEILTAHISSASAASSKSAAAATAASNASHRRRQTDGDSYLKSNVTSFKSIKSTHTNNRNRSTEDPALSVHDSIYPLAERSGLCSSTSIPLSEEQHSRHPSTTLARVPSTCKETRRIKAPRAASRGHLSKEVKAIRGRIRKLWQDPHQADYIKSRREPKNQYIVLEESLTGMLQIVPPIIQNAKEPSSATPFSHPGAFPEPDTFHPPPMFPLPANMAESSAATATVAASSNPPSPTPAHSLPVPTSSRSKSSGSAPSTPVHTRARTTSSNSTSTLSATRFQIATSILQPPEPPLTDVAQPTILSPTSIASLGEPALSTITASMTSPLVPGLQFQSSITPRLADSNHVLISKLLSLSNAFTGAIRTLCEQQNEKVLRFDDDMIMELLTRWEKEAEIENPDQEPANSSTTSLVTLGATNALERYQITVARVWEETEAILSNIRKIRDIVEYGRVQNYSDFDDDDSEEEVIERDAETKKTLYKTLLDHANGLVTVLGEFLECVSGIQRLVGTIKTQRRSMDSRRAYGDQCGLSQSDYGLEGQLSIVDFLADEPRPVRHLDPAMMRKLKRKTPFKVMADKVRRSLSDFAKRSTSSLLTFFPPLGDGTNEGFHWDSYSEGDSESDEWLRAAAMGSTLFADEEYFMQSLSPPESPGFRAERHRLRHRRMSSQDSSKKLDQYWPGSTRLGLSDDSLSPTKPSSPFTASSSSAMVDSQSMAMSRSTSHERAGEPLSARYGAASNNSPTALRASIESLREAREFMSSLPFENDSYMSPPASSRPEGHKRSSIFRRRSSQTPAYTATSISAPIPTSTRPFSVHSSGSETHTPSRHNYKARPPRPPGALPPMPPSPTHSYFKADEFMQETVSLKQASANRTSSYLATRSISPHQSTPLILDSPFTRQTSIRMGNDRNRYSVRMPADDLKDAAPITARNFPASFWRRRSYSDVLERNWKSFQPSGVPSETSTQSTPVASEFEQDVRSSQRLTSFEFMVPYFSNDSSNQGGRPGSGSMSSVSRPTSTSRRHSSPLTHGAEKALADALSRRLSVSSQQSEKSTSQATNSRSSVHMMPTVEENSYTKKRQGQEFASGPPIGSTEQQPASAPVSLGVPSRPRLNHRSISQDNTRVGANRKDRSMTDRYRPPAVSDSRVNTEGGRRPGSVSRFGDMKKAWEILNLDVKRINQYSPLRAYAKAYTAQNNQWAFSHPNALRSATSPRVLHICENGADVLVLEMFAGHLQVVAGQLEKLVERLADENAQDMEYMNCFLLSHSFFIDSEDLLDRLIARFHIQPRQGEILYFERWQMVIQCKILLVLQRWIQIQYEDFELNPSLLKTMKRFLEVDVRTCGFVMEAESIEKYISAKSLSPLKNCSVIMEQGRFCLQRSRTRKLSLSKAQSRGMPGSPGLLSPYLETVPPSPMEPEIQSGQAPELLPESPIMRLDTLYLARYLTLADMKAFRSITVFELMSGWWKRRQAADNKTWENENEADSRSASGTSEAGDAEDGAIEAFTRRANMLSYWVAHEILSLAEPKRRKQLIKKFIEVAKICRSLNNLHTAMFIVSALSSTPVQRLTSTWKLVAARDMDTLHDLETLLDPSGNMRHYRQAIAGAEAPTIPFLPILLKDITFILDGNPTMIASRMNVSDGPGSADSHQPASGGMDSRAGAGAEAGKSMETKTMDHGPTGGQLVNFDKFRRLAQYVEDVVDMARSNYSFDHQLLHQARVFHPSGSSSYVHGGPNDADSVHGSVQSGRQGNSSGVTSSSRYYRGALDEISDIVEHRLVQASGLIDSHQTLIEVEFSTKPKSSNGLWKGAVVGGSSGSGVGSSGSVQGSSMGETVIRSVQGEEEYLMGLSILCESHR
ncbi:unnamed protein product [Mortierella alpina]